MNFCQICDRPFPDPMLSDGICADCWRGHANDLADAGEADAALWACAHARAARGSLQLTNGEEG
jgi:hypothetical protein